MRANSSPSSSLAWPGSPFFFSARAQQSKGGLGSGFVVSTGRRVRSEAVRYARRVMGQEPPGPAGPPLRRRRGVVPLHARLDRQMEVQVGLQGLSPPPRLPNFPSLLLGILFLLGRREDKIAFLNGFHHAWNVLIVATGSTLGIGPYNHWRGNRSKLA